MRKLEYQVTFNTPAFLGNADQQAQWRTPPFKALLRQWWRVVHAPKVASTWTNCVGREQAVWRGGGRGQLAAVPNPVAVIRVGPRRCEGMAPR